jgi:GntR family transcriptional regulator
MNDKINILFTIQPSSGIPIYKQIIDQVNRLVISGFLKPGDEIPSVRQVASNFDVNPMTISKAYSLLEATGVLERIRGKGMIVASNQDGDQSLKKRLEMIQPSLKEAAIQANQLGLPKEKVIKAFKQLLEE